jgi:hypothetical protein
MGDLEPYMDEQFVQQALAAVGETVVSVRLIRQKGTNVPAGYCFIEFSSEQQATTALSRLSGIPIPGTQPMKRFRLNWANSGAVGGVAAPPGYVACLSLSACLSLYNILRFALCLV